MLGSLVFEQRLKLIQLILFISKRFGVKGTCFVPWKWRNLLSWTPKSLLGRTNLTLGFSSMLIAVVAIFSLNLFVIAPIAERSADDEAALLVLSAQTWVELPPEARPYFE